MDFISIIYQMHFKGYKLLLFILMFLLIHKSWRGKIWEIIELINLAFAVFSLTFLADFLSEFFAILLSSNTHSNYNLVTYAFGTHWYGFWAGLSPYFLGLLFFFRKIRRNLIPGIILLILMNFENYVIIATSFEREYIPASWANWRYIFPIQHIVLNLFYYSAFVGFLYYLKQRDDFGRRLKKSNL